MHRYFYVSACYLLYFFTTTELSGKFINSKHDTSTTRHHRYLYQHYQYHIPLYTNILSKIHFPNIHDNMVFFVYFTVLSSINVHHGFAHQGKTVVFVSNQLLIILAICSISQCEILSHVSKSITVNSAMYFWSFASIIEGPLSCK